MTGCSEIQGIFDLKGSMVNRFQKLPKGQKAHKPTKTLKDLNLLNLCKERLWLQFRKKDRESILKSIKVDVDLLQRFNLMDYSLLLTITTND